MHCFSYAYSMLIRGLPLIAGIAPVLGIALAYWLGVRAEVVPSCMPLFDGCVSISATGRYMPGSLPFRAVMMPHAVVLAFLWYFAAHWLDTLSPAGKAQRTILISGCVGALALILYVTFLGTREPFYTLMRRFGIYFYFLGTVVAQLTLAISLLRPATRAAQRLLKRYALTMVWLSVLPLSLGVLNLILKSVLEDAAFAEKRIEWISALFMQGYFLVLYLAWRDSGFSLAVHTTSMTGENE
jgi:hypothetical protein